MQRVYCSIWIIFLLSLFSIVSLAAQTVDFGGYLGLDYILEDSSVYPKKIYESDFPSQILPLRGTLGVYAATALSEKWQMGIRAQLSSLNGDGVLDDKRRVYLSSLSIPIVLTVKYGKSPYVGAGIGYSLGMRSNKFFNIDETSGFVEGLRVGWYGFYLNLEAVVSGNFSQRPEYKIGLGYEDFLQLLSGAAKMLPR